MKSLLDKVGLSVVGDINLDNIKWRDKIEVCDKDGYRGVVTKDSVARGCGFKIYNPFNPHTINNIHHFIKLNNLHCELLSETYENSKTKLKFKCECGEEYLTTVPKFTNRRKHQCNNCGLQARSSLRTNNCEEVCHIFNMRGLSILNADRKITSGQKVSCIDNEGYLYYSTLDNVKVAIPPKFSVYNPYTIFNMKKYIEVNSIPVVLIDEEYLKKDSYLKFKCECGNEYDARWVNVIRQNHIRCKTCSKKQSIGEYLVETLLISFNLDYKCEFKYVDCKNKNSLPFDFRVLIGNKPYLIEVDGSQHYIPRGLFGGEEGFRDTQFRDSIKTDYCLKNCIPLLRIPYTKFNKQEDYKSSIIDFLGL